MESEVLFAAMPELQRAFIRSVKQSLLMIDGAQKIRKNFRNGSGVDKGVESTIKAVLFMSLAVRFGVSNVAAELKLPNDNLVKDLVVLGDAGVRMVVEVKAYRHWCTQGYEKDFHSIENSVRESGIIGCFVQYSLVERPSQLGHIRTRVDGLRNRGFNVSAFILSAGRCVDLNCNESIQSPNAIIVCCDKGSV